MNTPSTHDSPVGWNTVKVIFKYISKALLKTPFNKGYDYLICKSASHRVKRSLICKYYYRKPVYTINVV